jgi:hypothetical protein
MEFLLFLGFSVAFLAFIAWDRRRLNQTSAPQVRSEKQRIVASEAKFSNFTIGLAAVSGALALSEWLSPTPRPYTGRLSWLKELAFSLMGTNGPAGLWLVASLSLLLLGIALRVPTQARGPK